VSLSLRNSQEGKKIEKLELGEMVDPTK
jgi:hypothetical protein